MARYQVGSSVYEIPDNVPEAQLQQILTQLAAQEAPNRQQRDGALGYSVDQAQRLVGKGIEAVGRTIGSETVADYGSEVVQQQDRDIEQGGYQSKYNDSLVDTFGNQGISGAVGWIAEKTLENAASGGLAIGGAALTLATAPFSAPAAAIIGGSTAVGSGLMGAGGAAFEQEEKVGDYSPGLSTGVGALTALLDRFGAGKVVGTLIPKDKLATMTGEELVDTLMKNGYTEAAEGIGRKIATAGISEAATEAAQEGLAVGSAAVRGGEYTGEELRDRALEAAVLGGTMGTGARAGIETTSAAGRSIKTAFESMSSGEDLTPQQQQARTDFANRLQRIAQQNGFNLKKVGKMDDGGAVKAVDTAHVDISTSIDELVNVLRDKLSRNDLDSESQADLKRMAKAAVRMAKNKTKSVVTQAEFDAMAELVGDTKEGQQLLSLFRESNELTALHNSGYVGGVSQYTDALSPFTSGAGYDRSVAVTERILRPAVSTSFAFQTGGASLAAQAAAAGAGRAIDAVTGRRSRVNRFVQDNVGQGSATPGGPSVRQQRADTIRRIKAAQEAEREAKKRQRENADIERRERAAEERRKQQEAVDIHKRNYDDGVFQRQGYKPDSPQGILLAGTGMDVENVVQALRDMANDGPMEYRKAARAALKSLRNSGEIPALTYLIPAINDYSDSGRTTAKPVRERDRGAVDAAQARAVANDPRTMGIEANRRFAQGLIDALDAATNVEPVYKDEIRKTLEILKNDDLGSDPVARAEKELKRLHQRLSDPDVVPISEVQINEASILGNNLVGQYIDRIKDQQEAAKKRKAEEAPKPPKKAPKPKAEPAPASPPPPLNPEPKPPILEDEGGSNDGDADTGAVPAPIPVPQAPPTEAEVEEAKKATDTIFEIGKKGSKYENGIDSFGAVETIAKALGLKFEVYASPKEMGKAYPSAKPTSGGYTGGFFSRKGNRIVVLRPGAFKVGKNDIELSYARALATALHELGHGMDLKDNVLGDHFEGNQPKAKLYGRTRTAYTRANVTTPLIRLLEAARSDPSKHNQDKTHPIIKELYAFQERKFNSPTHGEIDVRPAFPDLEQAAQNARDKGMDEESIQKHIKKHMQGKFIEGYIRSPHELIADALMGYMINPKEFKKVAPKTAEFIRQSVNPNSNLNDVITFHSTPLVAILAGLMAAFPMMMGENEDNEGVLSMGDGALTL